MKFTKDYKFRLEIADLITDIRLKKGLTQQKVAKKSGMLQSAISRVERGSYLPSIRTLHRICEATGFELKISLEEKVEKNKNPNETH